MMNSSYQPAVCENGDVLLCDAACFDICSEAKHLMLKKLSVETSKAKAGSQKAIIMLIDAWLFAPGS